MDDLILKTSDLYNNILYTVIPIDMSTEFGIYPEDQQFHKNLVFLWDSYSNLTPFDTAQWKKLKVIVPDDIMKSGKLTRVLVSTYGIDFIPNTWKIEEQKINPLYNE